MSGGALLSSSPLSSEGEEVSANTERRPKGHQFELAQNPSDIISAVKFAPDNASRLLVSSWDKNVYLYDIHGEPGGKLLQKYEHRAVVLDVCFGRNENEAFSCGLDCDVRR